MIAAEVDYTMTPYPAGLAAWTVTQNGELCGWVEFFREVDGHTGFAAINDMGDRTENFESAEEAAAYLAR